MNYILLKYGGRTENNAIKCLKDLSDEPKAGFSMIQLKIAETHGGSGKLVRTLWVPLKSPL